MKADRLGGGAVGEGGVLGNEKKPPAGIFPGG